MHRYSAPLKPANFERLVKNVQHKVRVAVTSRSKPDFSDKWRQFKAHLSAAQNRKCGFCDGYAIGQHYGDVEHYAPKSELESLFDDPQTWGSENSYLANVVGRKTRTICNRGYWWRAYEWDNYVLACAICNQQWKKAIFPVAEPSRTLPPRPRCVETPLLLHPFRGPRPEDHLKYGALGEVEARDGSPYGFETIRTLGLDRPSLRGQRATLARNIHRKIDALASSSPARRRDLLDDIYDAGDSAQAFCGMVRCIFRDRTGMTWDELEERMRVAKGASE
jgi:hypothetical protein